ncbi:hypothetical protein D3C77_567660 [compost metagenome]
MELLYETVSMLKQHIDSGTAIVLEKEDEDELLRGIVALLQEYELTKSRKMTVLGCCMLIRMAIKKHRELALHRNDELTRSILDGDYLIGLYYRFATGRKEWKLLTHLAPFHKKMQVALLAGRPVRTVMTELHEEIRIYLNKQCA